MFFQTSLKKYLIAFFYIKDTVVDQDTLETEKNILIAKK